MTNKKVKIVLDADVIIHFQKAGYLSLLPDIFPEYECIILSVVYDELITIRTQLDNHIHLLKNITLEPFSPNGDMAKEYALLLRKFGKGESAGMSYCKFNNDVLGSSNLRDIKEYCQTNGITYLTTLNFLYYATIRKKMTIQECNEFIQIVRLQGSKLPDIDISNYSCQVQI